MSQRGNGGDASVHAPPTSETELRRSPPSDDLYFKSYAHLGIHQEMIRVRSASKFFFLSTSSLCLASGSSPLYFPHIRPSNLSFLSVCATDQTDHPLPVLPGQGAIRVVPKCYRSSRAPHSRQGTPSFSSPSDRFQPPRLIISSLTCSQKRILCCGILLGGSGCGMWHCHSLHLCRTGWSQKGTPIPPPHPPQQAVTDSSSASSARCTLWTPATLQCW